MRCDSLGSAQRGQGRKWGTGCFITCARRMAERDLDCLLFGTAIDPSFRFAAFLVIVVGRD
jgi:hypothetical protein